MASKIREAKLAGVRRSRNIGELMRVRKSVVAVVAAALCLSIGSADAVTTPVATQLSLAIPAGPHAVGRTIVHLTDAGRADPWVPARRRELMVSLWYPAVPVWGPAAGYTTAKESELLIEHAGGGMPPDLLTTVRTYARTGVPVLPRAGGRPLVVLSPGWELPRSSLSGLAEDLASRGYVVAAVDHTYESVAVEFPDGRVTDCVACDQRVGLPPDQDEKFFEKVTAGRVADVSFVVDQLTGSRPAWPQGRWIDSGRIAVVGHSIGGSTALSTMVADGRIRAGVNMDGRFSPPLAAPLNRPFLLLGSAPSVPGSDIAWDPTWDRLAGWKRWLTVAKMGHESFSDLALLFGQLGRPMQELDGARCTTIATEYVSAFLGRHLHDRSQPLLDGPSSRYPEVAFH